MAAARAAARDPAVVTKADYPSRDDFDAALEELAGLLWDPEQEPNYTAYARALDSPEGRLLYAAREWAPKPLDPPVQVQKLEPLAKAERKIHKLAAEYRARHHGTTPEKAVIRVLDSNPDLYTQYLRECK
jgi:hypothetical protein